MTETLVHDLLLILAGGLLASLICRRLRSSVLIGYLLVGVLLGQGILGWVQDENHQLEHFAEVGVFLLLFSIGLEFSIDDLKRLGRHFVVGGFVQMVLVFVPVAIGLMFFQMAWRPAVLIAIAVAFSSTVLVFKSLSEWGQSQQPHGQRAIGILLFQDAALVPLLLLLPMLVGTNEAVVRLESTIGQAVAVGPQFVDSQVSGSQFAGSQYVWMILTSLCFVASIVVLRNVLAKWVIPRLAGYRSPEMVVLFTIVSLGGVTLAAYQVGLPPAVGAFAAGLIFNGNRWTTQIDALVLPFRETFAAIFFVGLGLILDPRLILQQPLLMGATMGSVMVIKTAAATVALSLTGMSWRNSFAMGIGLAHVGEFAFVVVLIGMKSNILTELQYQQVVAISVGSLLLTPPLLKAALGMIQEVQPDNITRPLITSIDSAHRQAVVIGAGPIGTRVTAQLETMGKDVCLIDFSPINLHPFTQAGFRTVAGDATDLRILELADVRNCFVVVVSVPDDRVALRILKTLRRSKTTAKLIVRCRYQSNVSTLRKAGADSIVTEETEATLALLRTLSDINQNVHLFNSQLISTNRPVSTNGSRTDADHG
ncbi:Kef-type potassium/proton antiporter, CPA2 family [Neorhodopirellula lusitana]|uniref:Kef-type potassium/proton antiporter, CPA2 family n=1 Tax=Neorhodopirellula lusitana TaxID=445327 RepID=A0ABY1QM92_9BACT|nr:cation:proton antiporter [Neorhodopirellula lusitana]SMP74892.1 Kef-type potassium/proton antiporter, CPA2 family [Neorhodopirellula lusitana]